MTYTAETKKVMVGLLPDNRREVTQYRVLLDDDLYGHAKTAEGAEMAAKMLNGEHPMSEEDRARIFS